jgi:hypothetical protein
VLQAREETDDLVDLVGDVLEGGEGGREREEGGRDG